MIAGQTHYSLEIATKPKVPPFHPFLVSCGVYQSSAEFREILLAKLINANRAAMHAPDFSHKHERTRKMLMQDLLSALPLK
mmetsp:Transcript_3433/g.4261  ORF Transcript_3433/g.4261 Transcript_3433/m.4261 type:complete len:81 (-) Transcript_3433:19-261(-)